MRYIFFSFLSILCGLTQAYLHSFQIDYITFLGTGILFFFFGFLIGKQVEQKFGVIIYILPSLGILLFGFFTNPFFFYHGVVEICLITIFYFLGLLYYRLRGLMAYKASFVGLFLVLLVLSFYINPLKNLHDFEVNSDSLIENNFEKGYSFLDTNGNKVLLDSLDDKIVIIDYWFIGCLPCYKKMEKLEEIQKYFSNDQNIKILFVNCGADSYVDFLNESKRLNYKVPQLYDDTKSFIKMNDISSYPYEIIINKGKIISLSSGYNDDAALYYFNHVKSILKKLK